ncbi:tyrosyl-DNA phodphodiesterase 1 [Cryptosporidium ubiquitum]|uniref:Tyrosyl-DNA phodphodiesterase 1 n=1 Tax=Cryptosporidium ubiquitum TaxID=857276 RepID=A0A1J4MIR6_9CRYT|nr:tyrosyl-DNA phodphodiesterase 1 [Cryptosporidium ubiquitum]OII74112.1 tyrosyl-DNA phodphodiesterase 1 [Cryptosporidium ubiquitum]
MNICDKVDISRPPSFKKTKFNHDIIEILSDSSEESNLGNVNSNYDQFRLETPIYLNELNFEKKNSKNLSFKSFFVVNDQISIKKSSWQIKNIFFSSYINDVEWVIKEIEDSELIHKNIESILFVSHHTGNSISCKFSNHHKIRTEKISIHSPYLKVPYGVFHPKFILIVFEHLIQPKMNFIRFVITSANLIRQDWEFKSQSIWVQDFFLTIKKKNCEFSEYLHEFLKNILNGSKLQEFWLSKIQEFNFEDATIKLVASVPGYFFGHEMFMWGHLRVKSLLKNVIFKKINKSERSLKEQEKIILQFSSIGRISEKWLYKELVSSLSETPETRVEIIFPTIKQVLNSIEGIEGGGSLPVKKEYICKPWITKLLHRWGEGSIDGNISTEKAIPHIKTFLKYKMFNNAVQIIWLIQGSYNLSNAAWGQLQKDKSQYCIRNYELGIFLHIDQFEFERYDKSEKEEEFPKFVWKRKTDHSFDSKIHNNQPNKLLDIPLPFKLPPRRYSSDDIPWNIELLM